MAKTSLIGLTLPATGTLSGQWGDTVNNAISQIVDVAVAGTQTITVDTDIDLAVTEGTYASTGLTANSSQYAVLLCTGARTAARNINTPKQSKTYVVINDTTGGFAVTVRGGPTSPTTGVSVAAGTRAMLAWNGSDFVRVEGTGTVTSVAATVPSIFSVSGSPITSSGTLAMTYSGTALPVANGGTGATALTANNVILGNGTSAVQVVAPGTNGNVLTSNGTTWASSAAATQTYPGAGIANSTGSAWGTSYTTSGSGTVVALNNTPTLTNPTVTNYVETPFSANSSTAITIALTNGTVQIITLTGNATITMPTAVSGKSFIMFLRQDVTGSRSVTWSTVNWASATAPTITSTASKQDIYSFFSDGTSWYGVTVGQNFTQ
jgi:hypothetical protein